ncbi:MFS transporter, partial [Streptomyces sp. W16]|uniref:MFS transporter n=1 Tax=Streptomyces sp. W16 TaxID=3076631 RepID=UPI00295BE66D
MTRFSERTLNDRTDRTDRTLAEVPEKPEVTEVSAPRPRATLALTSAATAVALMTYTAPMVTLPDIAAALHTPLSAQAWLLNGTPLGLAALLLVAGSLADDYGRRRIFLAGTFALGITTALSALTSSTLLFTLTRIAQGASSAALLASSLGLIVHAFPTPRGRLHATGVWGAFVSGGIAIGPLVAGALPDWRVAYDVLGDIKGETVAERDWREIDVLYRSVLIPPNAQAGLF